MILGIGVDLCSVARISEALYRNSDANQLISDSAFCQRILSKEELLELSTTQHKENFVTKKWTAKEALCKASGNGMIIGFNNITIAHEASGKPYFKLNEVATDAINKAFGIQSFSTHLSISDEDNMIIAFAIISI